MTTCAAQGCTEPLDTEWKVMCGRHWHLVPQKLRFAILLHPLSPDPEIRARHAEARKDAIAAAVSVVERSEFGGRLL